MNDLLIAGTVLCLAAIGLIAAAGWIRHLLARDIARSNALALAVERTSYYSGISITASKTTSSPYSRSSGCNICLQRCRNHFRPDCRDDCRARTDLWPRSVREGFRKTLLSDVVDMLVKSYGSSVEVECAIEDVDVSADTATPLALLANEVVTNSLKPALPHTQAGKITVTLKALSKRSACLVISDNCVGFDRENMHSGMRSRLIKGWCHSYRESLSTKGMAARPSRPRWTSLRLPTQLKPKRELRLG